jgi:hypothetical protein
MEGPMAAGGSGTLDPVLETYSVGRAARARMIRRITLTLVLVLVLLGATGVLGVRSGRVSASSNDYQLVVTYPRVARLGLSIVWRLEVRKSGGFRDTIVVATTRSYFEIFDENGVYPAPSSEVTEGDMLVWEFDPPQSGALIVTLDHRIEPTYRGARRAQSVILEDDRVVTGVRYATVVLP